MFPPNDVEFCSTRQPLCRACGLSRWSPSRLSFPGPLESQRLRGLRLAGWGCQKKKGSVPSAGALCRLASLLPSPEPGEEAGPVLLWSRADLLPARWLWPLKLELSLSEECGALPRPGPAWISSVCFARAGVDRCDGIRGSPGAGASSALFSRAPRQAAGVMCGAGRALLSSSSALPLSRYRNVSVRPPSSGSLESWPQAPSFPQTQGRPGRVWRARGAGCFLGGSLLRCRCWRGARVSMFDPILKLFLAQRHSALRKSQAES